MHKAFGKSGQSQWLVSFSPRNLILGANKCEFILWDASVSRMLIACVAKESPRRSFVVDVWPKATAEAARATEAPRWPRCSRHKSGSLRSLRSRPDRICLMEHEGNRRSSSCAPAVRTYQIIAPGKAKGEIECGDTPRSRREGGAARAACTPLQVMNRDALSARAAAHCEAESLGMDVGGEESSASPRLLRTQQTL